MKLKKLVLAACLTVATLGLTGCSVDMNVAGLNQYISTSPDSVNGVGTTLSDTISNNATYLDSIYETFSGLDNVLNENANLNLRSYIDAMNAWQAKILPDADLMKESKVTDLGGTILSSIALDNAAINGIFNTTLPHAIQKVFYGRITGSDDTKNQFLNLDGTTTASKLDSRLNRFITLFGYKFPKKDAISYEVYYTGGSNNLNNDCSSFIKSKGYKASGVTDENYNITYSFNLDTDNRIYYLSIDNTTTEMKIGGTGINFQTNPKAYYYYDDKGNKQTKNSRIYLTTVPPSSTDIEATYEALWNAKGKNDNKVTKKEILDWLNDDHPVHLNRLLHDNGCISDATTCSDYIYSENSEDEIDYELPFTQVKRLYVCGDKDTVYTSKEALRSAFSCGTDTLAYVFVRVKIKHTGTSKSEATLDIREQAKQTTSSVTAFPSLPTDTGIFSARGYSQYANLAYMDNYAIVKELRKYSKGQLLVLNSELDSKKYPDMSSFNISNYTSSNLVTSGDFKFLTDSKGNPLELNLLDNIGKDDATEIKEYTLYMGQYALGTLYVSALNSKIADNATAMVITENGTKKEAPVQKFKYYYDNSKQQAYLLYGLSDVAYINKIHAAPVTNSDSHEYTPTVELSGMMYNIFDKKIYFKGNDNGASTFDTTSNIQLYSADGSDIAISNRNTGMRNNDSAMFISTSAKSNSNINKIKNQISKCKTPLVLKTYLEGVYLPDVAGSDKFACLGRRIVFNRAWFDKDATITENTPAFTIVTPQGVNKEDETSTHHVGELLSSKMVTKSHTEQVFENGEQKTKTSNVSGISKLNYLTYTDEIRSKSEFSSYKNVNILFNPNIYSAEFKTAKSDFVVKDSARRYATHCDGTEVYWKSKSPRLFVWCTDAGITNTLASYIESAQFGYWTAWLGNNGYTNYLGDMSAEDFNNELLYKIELTYDITLDPTKGSSDILVDTDGLEVLDNWVKDKTTRTDAAVLDVVMSVLGVALLFYGILLLACYIIDTGVAGEGDGTLKKITFNRMKSVTGMTKAERKQLTEHSEKGTYTTRAVNFTDVLVVSLIIWAIAVIVLAGVSYDIVDKLLKIGDTITQIIQSTLKRE